MCDGNADATYKLGPDGFPRWYVGCFGTGCRNLGGEYLTLLAEHVEAQNGALILEDPLRYLASLIDEGRGRLDGATEPAPLPSEATLGGWQRDRRASGRAMAYLLDARGLSRKTIQAARLGYDRERSAITIPVYEGGQLVNVRRRFLSPAAVPKITGLAGRGSQLYPAPPGEDFILCEGEFDALLAGQHGLPAVTSTAGTAWKKEWNVYAAERRVAVVFDSGEAPLAIAHRRAEELLATGAVEAWPVDLGLEDGEDLTDWFVTYGRTPEALKRRINRAWRASR